MFLQRALFIVFVGCGTVTFDRLAAGLWIASRFPSTSCGGTQWSWRGQSLWFLHFVCFNAIHGTLGSTEPPPCRGCLLLAACYSPQFFPWQAV